MRKYYISTWEKERDRRYIFPAVCDSEMKNISRIHPLLQKQADAVYRAVCGDRNISMIIVFGSALNMRCTGKSDIDLAVKLKEECISDEKKNSISEKIQAACDWNADIVWRDRLQESDQILQDIRKGVILLEQAAETGKSEAS